jgi:hypothetical protein
MCSALERHGVQAGGMSPSEGAVQFGAARHDSQAAIRQRPLQLERIAGRRRQPRVDFFRRRQDYRHRLRMEGADFLVGVRREEPVEIGRNRPLLQFSHRRPLRHPDSCETGKRSAFIERKPGGWLAAIGLLIRLGKAGPRYYAPIVGTEPAPPMGRCGVPHVCYASIDRFSFEREGWRRQSAACPDQLAARRTVANDRRGRIRKDRRHRFGVSETSPMAFANARMASAVLVIE